MVGVADTWDVRIPIGVKIRRINARELSDAASGYARGRHTSYQEPRMWELRWPDANAADFRQLSDLHDNTHGGALALTFTPPEGGGATVAFIVPGSFRYVLRGVDMYDLRCKLRGDPA